MNIKPGELKKMIVIISICLAIFVALFIVVEFVGVIVFVANSSIRTGTNHPNVNSISPKTYKSLKMNHETMEMSIEVISIQEDIEDFKSYQSEEGDYILISNFGTEEYECTGKCYCENDERRTSATISHGMMYLVAAISAVGAINLAENYFEEECHRRLSDSCTYKSVKSEVDDCGPAIIPEVLEKERIKQKFWCGAPCQVRDWVFGNLIKAESVDDIFKCTKSYTENEVEVDITEIDNPLVQELEAQRVFQETILEGFCIAIGKMEVMNSIESKDMPEFLRGKVIDLVSKKRPEDWSPCVAKIGEFDNPYINCRKV